MADTAESAQQVKTNEEKRYAQNSYHYFHNHAKDRADAGDVATKAKPALVSVSDDVPVTRAVKNISKYSWADGKKIISIYIDFPGVGAMQDKVHAVYKKRSLCLTIETPEGDYALRLIRLNQRIDGEKSLLKFKDNQVVMKVAKEEENKWYDLFKTTVRGVSGSDSDE